MLYDIILLRGRNMNTKEILKKYNISEATLRNWKKLQYITDLNNIYPAVIDNIIKNKSGIRRNTTMHAMFAMPIV